MKKKYKKLAIIVSILIILILAFNYYSKIKINQDSCPYNNRGTYPTYKLTEIIKENQGKEIIIFFNDSLDGLDENSFNIALKNRSNCHNN